MLNPRTQEGGLFPHLTVAANVGFALSRSAHRRRVGDLLELVGWRIWRAATPTSSPAASSSASPWPERSRSNPRWCSWTNRSRHSTRKCALRDLSGDYDAEHALCATHRALLEALAAFELDLHQHIHEENNVLLPRVRELAADVRPIHHATGDPDDRT
jgi:hypothetical protein